MRALSVVATVVAIGVLVAVAPARQPPPVIRYLGPYEPTPAPSPGAADRIRLVTSITVRNSPDGKSIISFEVTDLARSTEKREGEKQAVTTYQVLATENYSLAEPKKHLVGMRDDIVARLRDLEHELLQFAEKVGPPRVRARITDRVR